MTEEMRGRLIPRVARGAAWLDAYHPGWERRIDLTRLCMVRCDRCVIGQAVMNFTCSEWGNREDAWEYGFTLRSAEHAQNWKALEVLWTELVKERFSAGVLSDDDQ